MTNSGIYQWFCLWRWCKMYNPGCAFVFFVFFLPQRQANFVKMPLPPRMHLWEPMCLFPQRRVFFTRWLVLPTTWPLECHTGETSYHAQQMWISIANCGYAKVSVLTESLRDFGIWVFICFQQLSMVPVWTLKALFRNLSVRWNSPALAKIK